MREAQKALSIDQGLKGPQGLSRGRGRKPFSMAQLVGFMKLKLGQMDRFYTYSNRFWFCLHTYR